MTNVCIFCEHPTFAPSAIPDWHLESMCNLHKRKLVSIYKKYIKILVEPSNPKYRSGLASEKLISNIMEHLAKTGSQTTEQLYKVFWHNRREEINSALYHLVETTMVLRHDFKGNIRYKMNPDNSPIPIQVIG